MDRNARRKNLATARRQMAGADEFFPDQGCDRARAGCGRFNVGWHRWKRFIPAGGQMDQLITLTKRCNGLLSDVIQDALS